MKTLKSKRTYKYKNIPGRITIKILGFVTKSCRLFSSKEKVTFVSHYSFIKCCLSIKCKDFLFLQLCASLTLLLNPITPSNFVHRVRDILRQMYDYFGNKVLKTKHFNFDLFILQRTITSTVPTHCKNPNTGV